MLTLKTQALVGQNKVVRITTFSGTSNGEAVTMNLGDRTLFADLVGYTDANDGGSFVLQDADWGHTYNQGI